MADVFVPEWAERELKRERPLTAAETEKLREIYKQHPERGDISIVELDLLRNFFDSWQALHAIPTDKFHQRKKEVAAQNLTDAAHAVIRYRDPVNRPQNG